MSARRIKHRGLTHELRWFGFGVAASSSPSLASAGAGDITRHEPGISQVVDSRGRRKTKRYPRPGQGNRKSEREGKTRVRCGAANGELGNGIEQCKWTVDLGIVPDMSWNEEALLAQPASGARPGHMGETKKGRRWVERGICQDVLDRRSPASNEIEGGGVVEAQNLRMTQTHGQGQFWILVESRVGKEFPTGSGGPALRVMCTCIAT
ncbi:hypothetical protein K438DRAFT_1790388 [Mycena galopus ATCC 62051]|nr:hypothetical protein K438DRAFT_1790388 [Mycena galopus ATCC 62051]